MVRQISLYELNGLSLGTKPTVWFVLFSEENVNYTKGQIMYLHTPCL